METPKPTNGPKPPARAAAGAKPASSPSTTAPKTAAPAAPAAGKLPPLFRRIDWLTMLIAFGVVWVVYFLTLAPEVTLEDSGELCTGAFYAGIPHPPGYPFWAIYSWFWSNFLPFGNVAWRVEVGESTAAALACGLVGLMVSRGSSMLIEGIEDLKGVTGKWENAICLVCGAVAGIMLGLGRTMWSESVAINRISLFGAPWVMLVLLCLMRWIYEPRRIRYIYIAMFLFGICGTIHQTLLCAGIGIEAAIAVTRPRLGRTFFLGNSVMFLMVLIASLSRLTDKFDTIAPTLAIMYVSVGVISIGVYFWLAIVSREGVLEFCRDGAAVAFFLLLMPAIKNGLFGGGILFTLLALGALGAFIKFAFDTHRLGLEWVVVIVCGILCLLGISFYLYEPLSGMTNPPMEWGYPRTVDGFWHALSRGQYDKAYPTAIFTWAGMKQYTMQLGQLLNGIAEAFNWVVLFLALVPPLFIFKMQKRERCWLIALAAVYACIGFLLLILMNPQDDRGSVDLHRVFFASSHGVIAIMIGYGMALTAAYMATHYQTFRTLGLLTGTVALLPALMALYYAMGNTFFGGAGIPIFERILLLFVVLTAAFVFAALAAQMLLRSRASAGDEAGDQKTFAMLFGSLSALCVCVAGYVAFFVPDLPVTSKQIHAVLPTVLSLHVAGFPVLAGVLILAVVMAFLVGLLLYRNRAPLTLTLGLLALMPVASLMTNWASSEQRNHWFGYWFGHDMFTPPFEGPDGKLTYDPQLRAEALKGTNAAVVYPEMARNAVLYGGTDPGRFCPTYMIFCESFIPHNTQPAQDRHFDRRDVYIITQNALADGTYLQYIRAQYNRSLEQDPPFFQELLRSDAEKRANYTTNFVARLAYKLLDVPFTKLGADIEARRRREGVYPPQEIYIATPNDLDRSYYDYQMDVRARMQHDQDPQLVARDGRLLKNGEGPNESGQISGTIPVMAINGLLTKIMFDHNPTNEFYVEESFPLDWMFPYLTPFGVIMKINREPLEEVPESEVRRDHAFWSKYSERLVGNWITYDTSIKEIVDFVERVHVRHDYTGFTGDRRFIRDDQAQKSFSKLRTAIGGIYAWRIGMMESSQVPTPAKYNDRYSRPAAAARMFKEADFAYRQAFAFCPYSAEVVFRYVPLLANTGRIDDAVLVAQTAYNLDPNNRSLEGLVRNLKELKNAQGRSPAAAPKPPAQAQATLDQLEKQFHDNPSDFQHGFVLAQAYMQMQQMPKAMEVMDQMLTNTNADVTVVTSIRNAYLQLNNYLRLEAAQERLTQVAPDAPENWYDLAGLQAIMGKNDAALKYLRRALEDSAKRLARDPKAVDLREKALTDPQLLTLRQLPEFQQLTAPPK